MNVTLKQNGKITFLGKALLSVGSVLGVLGAAWGLDTHFLPREVYTLKAAAQQKTMQAIQQSVQLQNALYWLQYWQREERDARNRYKQTPRDVDVVEDYKEAQDQRKKAQDYLNKVMKEMGN